LEQEENLRGLNIFSTKENVFSKDDIPDEVQSTKRDYSQVVDEKVQKPKKNKRKRMNFRNIPLKEEE
jgi:hypothetical protein